MALSAGWGQGPWSKDPPPQATALLGRGGMLLQDGSGQPPGQALGSSGNRNTEGTLDPRWESDVYEDLKSVTEQKEFTVAGGEV